MTRTGRPKKPAKVLEMEGAFKNHPERRRRDLEPDDGRPKMPAGFKGRHAQCWLALCETLDAVGILSATDSHALETYVRTWVDYIRLCKRIEREGMIYKVISREGSLNYRKHPATELLKDREAVLIRLWGQFGLTPSARAGLSIDTANKHESPFDQLKAIRGA